MGKRQLLELVHMIGDLDIQSGRYRVDAGLFIHHQHIAFGQLCVLIVFQTEKILRAVRRKGLDEIVAGPDRNDGNLHMRKAQDAVDDLMQRPVTAAGIDAQHSALGCVLPRQLLGMSGMIGHFDHRFVLWKQPMDLLRQPFSFFLCAL